MAKKTTSNTSNNLLLSLIHGRLLSIDYILKNWVYVLLGVGMIMVYITNRYQCLTLMEEIRRLEHRLEVVQTERIRERSEYMSRIRESSMQELVDSMRLDLHVQDKPPYLLEKQ
jgi:hypothetical protein